MYFYLYNELEVIPVPGLVEGCVNLIIWQRPIAEVYDKLWVFSLFALVFLKVKQCWLKKLSHLKFEVKLFLIFYVFDNFYIVFTNVILILFTEILDSFLGNSSYSIKVINTSAFLWKHLKF